MLCFFSHLNRDQKVAVGLLQFGTFLEYFDLLLYVHMGVILNELFFPKTDPQTAALLGAFAFCSTFVARPFGSLIFGYIGDNVGRKTTVILTTMLMSVSCITMANLPTYSQIGITAAWLVTLCRVMQGLSSMGEIVGAEIYLTETIKSSMKYPAVASLRVTTEIGGMFALFIATLVMTYGFNWRLAFWIGAFIALVGSAARTQLRETPDFVDMKRRVKSAVEDAENIGLKRAAELLMKTNAAMKEKTAKTTLWAYFLIECTGPLCFFLTFVYMTGVLKNTLNYAPEHIIQQNFIVSAFGAATCALFACLSAKIHPFKLVKARLYIFVPFILIYPYVLVNHLTPATSFFLQAFGWFFCPTALPALPILYSYFPVFRRFTYSSLIYALTRAFMHIVMSFGLIYLTGFLGHWGILVIAIPVLAGFTWGIRYFEKQEQDNPNSDYSQSLAKHSSDEQGVRTGTF